MKNRSKKNMIALASAGILIVLVAPVVFAGEAMEQQQQNDRPLAESYCNAFLKDAEAERQSRQKADLLAIQVQIEKKLAEVASRTAELDDWVSRRESILSRATLSLLKIYDVMESGAAAAELSKLDDVTASAILRMLKPKKSSDILTEMDPARAASLVAVIASDAKMNNGT
jgi:flagellar motility protein MotE (MotC chaperone)